MRFSLKALVLTAGFVPPLVWLIYSTFIATTMVDWQAIKELRAKPKADEPG